MTGRPLLLALLLAGASLAGCIGATREVGPTADQGLAATSAPPFSSPQTNAHPAWGWPTINMVPAAAPAFWQPIAPAPVPGHVTGLEHVAHAGTGAVRGGGGIALFGSLAIIPNFQLAGDGETAPTALLDISDPAAPRLLSELDSLARDADFVAFPDGRLVAVLATGAGVLPVWDVTDPTAPLLLAEVEPVTGTHNVAVVPGTPIVYNANTQGQPGPGVMPAVFSNEPVSRGQTEIYDLSDPDDPVLVAQWGNGYGCHDITFHIDPARGLYRAYCAGIEAVQIWDVTDPLAPAIVTTMPFHHGDMSLPQSAVGGATFAHLALVNNDATVLVVGDETGSGVAPACDKYLGDDGVGPARAGPGGNLYFYDITDETRPELRAFLSPDAALPSNPPPQEGPLVVAGCAAHFGRIVPHPTQELLAMAYYGAGVLLVDFTDPAAPVIVDQWNEDANTWDVWAYQGYLFTGDMARGMDVFTLR